MQKLARKCNKEYNMNHMNSIQRRRKNMENKKKNRVNVKALIISIILLTVISLMAKHLGLFEGMDSLVNVNVDTIVRVCVALSLIIVVGNVALIVIGLFYGKDENSKTVVSVVSSLIKYSMALVAGCWGASIIGVDVSTIFASVGIVALIIGFGAESLVADIITGIFMLFEGEYKVGHIVEVDGYRGTIVEIGIRTLSIVDGSGNIKRINNSSLSNVVNRSVNASFAVTDIMVSYEMDLEELEKNLNVILVEIEKKYDNLFNGKIKYLGVEALEAVGMKLRFCVELDEKNLFTGKRILNRELKIAFDKNNIKIAYGKSSGN